MKISGTLFVIKIYTDCRIRPHLRLLPEMVLSLSLTAIMLHNCYDSVMQLNLFEAEK